MPASWLYQINGDGLFVTHSIMERVSRGDRAAISTINREPLTSLYRANYIRPRRADAVGLFWSDVPPLELIPLVRGRASPKAWVKDHVIAETLKSKRNTWTPPKTLERAERSVRLIAKSALKDMKRGEQTVLVRQEGECLRAWKMKPNPMFDLVVVNRYDRAALLKLLGELEGAVNVPRWIGARTKGGGSTAATALHADYTAWCEQEGEAPAGSKGFGQALVASGVAKLPRSSRGVRYELQLR